MPIQRSHKRLSSQRLADVARELLGAARLCAISTVGSSGRAYVNTAYFAWSESFDVVWISEPHARHSRNLRANDSAAIAVFDSRQTWGKPDRGIQLFGSAREGGDDAERIYSARFPEYRREEMPAYRAYMFRPRRVKLFDERALGVATFVTARVVRDGTLTWERTERYRST
jgi:uncharacterized protein YhbP (UPF0306 family)